ncbi:MAG: tetratricopeptide repeat protein, partial [Bacteroidota bacterium]
MRIPLRALLSLLVLLGLSPSGWTQPIPSDATKRVPFAFEIVRTGASQGNSMAVTVRGTALERLVPDGLGVVYSTPTVNTRAATAGKPLVLGTARLVSIAGEEAEVMLRPRRPGDKQLLPRTGDVVALPIRVPRSTYEGYFLQHLQLGITLTDSSEVPIATPETIFELRGEADELRLVATLVAGLRAAGASLLARIDGGEVLPEVVVTPLPRGLYAGRRPVDVLAGATETDVLHLLDYLEEYPQQLVGARLQLASILLVWVSANAPLGERSLRTLLAEAPPAALDSLVEAYAGDHDAAFLPTWRSEAHAARDQERFEDAYFLYDLNLRIARTRSGAVWRKQAQLARQDLNALVNRLADNADRHLSANRPAKALETTVRGTLLFEKAFETGTAGVSRSDAGRLWYARGLALHALQRLDEARAAYDLAYDFYGTAGTKSGLQAQSRIRTRTASLERERGFFRAARNAYIEVAVRTAFLDDLEGEADALDELGYVMQQLGFPRLALAHWRKAAYLHRRSGVLTDVGYSLSATGSALWTLGQRDDAIAAHQQAIGVRSKTGDLPGEAYSWVQLGGLYGESGNPTAALDAYARADSLYAKADDASGQASVRSVRASVFFNQGDYVRALPLYQEALDGYTTAGDRTGRATTLNQLGDTYTGLRRYRDALAHYEDALELRRAIGDRSGEVQDLADLGTLASEGRYDRVAADRYFQTALALAQRTGDRGGAALAQGYYGRFLQQAGLFDEAQAALDDALAYWVAADNRQGEAWTRIDLGALAELQGDFAGAFEQYRTAL